MAFTPADAGHMARALQLARRGLYTTHPNPRVGCVLVRDGEVVGEGFHARAGEPHAEVHALRAAGARARGATAYVTLEPCCHHGRTPPCADALVEAGVSRVVAAMRDPNPLVAGGGLARLSAAGIEVGSGLLEPSARALNPGFINRMTRGLPWVRVKSAMSLDACTALASGESRWITDAAARYDVQRWRARADAILTGIDTVLADDPSLNVRLEPEELGIDGAVAQPLRVVLDSDLRMSPEARIFRLAGQVLVIAAEGRIRPATRAALEARGAEVVGVAATVQGRGLDLVEVLRLLARRGINEVHVEAGATLAGALVRESLVDELVIYVAPHLLGGGARAVFALPTLENMGERTHLEITQTRRVGDDWRLIAQLRRG
ncbi:bifunctional diaminohydroxyphosphoribosylaminopyrimidine deaminase/5-amino-6-(5-phosphoribosylamino)uracil reductase RibD [Acidihalobacter prosperus]|uniref:Riboflavin biosynthesis protein RibD n=1 Tax=Acidihalobacter prosperus TaxID=160660 RepID=A0A1A6C2B4_9GAMM|nr:bifunctional diaminohydroxyphosphoribosylaminopyrimidine deaminase/5-amino-6-(5-phosphoribosylamino)uracil reductase RibD [Acidihalobacter prosperus]OBS08706.1 Diaminohydroxyphosphoribosylaminopyrimidine deaminase / 5-amino-6-(5-phosphoribosylamino)uracil reductase [Acidihalobacter prosperus]